MDTLHIARAAGVVTVTLDRPDRKNALTHREWSRLHEVFAEVAERPDDRVLVLTGAGGEFCSGADVSALGDDERSSLEAMRAVGRTATALFHLPKPTIAKVDGVAVGAGCNLALACDLVVASERARFSEIFARRGLSLDFAGSWLLPRIVGLQRAKQLAYFADIVDAATASRLGLVTEVVAAGELDTFVERWAARLAAGPAVALSLTKALLNASSASIDEAVDAEAVAQAHNLGGPEAAEALRAFRERREPHFGGATPASP